MFFLNSCPKSHTKGKSELSQIYPNDDLPRFYSLDNKFLGRNVTFQILFITEFNNYKQAVRNLLDE